MARVSDRRGAGTLALWAVALGVLLLVLLNLGLWEAALVALDAQDYANLRWVYWLRALSTAAVVAVVVALYMRHDSALRTAELTRAHAESEEMRHRLDAMIQGSAVAKFLVSEDGRVEDVNLRCRELLGSEAEALVGRPFCDLVAEDGRETVRGALGDGAQPVNGHATEPLQVRMTRADRSEVEVELSLNRLRATYGLPPLTLATVLDVSRREALRRSNEDLQQFAYVASHDLQEPLRMVVSYSELLARRYGEQLDERADRYLGYCVDGARRMQSLVNDLLAYSRVEAAGALVPTDSNAACGEAVDRLAKAIEDAGGEVTVEALPWVMADAGQLERLFQNLISNALKFRGERPARVTVSATRRGASWEFAVADQGIGVPPEQAGQLFQMFRRLHGRSEYPGSGIGLAISRRIVERHGGHIWLESDGVSGTTVRFVLRAAEEGLR